MSLVGTIRDDFTDNARRFCRCCSGCCTITGCTASIIAVLLPASFLLQVIELPNGIWAYDQDCMNMDYEGGFPDNCTFGCGVLGNSDVRICVLAISAVSLEGLLSMFGVCVCIRTRCSNFDVRSCRFCYVCFIPVISLLPGILCIVCCQITAAFVHDYGHSYSGSFYTFLVTGCALILASFEALYGYIYMKYYVVRFNYQIQSGSDDADEETTPILPERQ